jgi:purine nucleosidase
MVHTYPNEITLVTIGPLTNIAHLFIIDPEIPALLKEIICMNGLFSNQIAGVGPLEWNAMGDPHASAIVYNRTQFNHKSIGLDITCQVGMSADDALKRFKGDLLQCVMDFARSFFEHSQWITFHDPLASLVAIDETICEFKQGKVDIELNSARLAGHTHWIDDCNGPHRVAHSVNCDRFFDLFFASFNT